MLVGQRASALARRQGLVMGRALAWWWQAAPSPPLAALAGPAPDLGGQLVSGGSLELLGSPRGPVTLVSVAAAVAIDGA